MKKFALLVLSLIMTATVLAGCRNPNLDMETYPDNTSLPTGTATESTTQRETQAQTTVPTTLPQTSPTTENPTTGTDNTGDNAIPESRFRRRMPGM